MQTGLITVNQLEGADIVVEIACIVKYLMWTTHIHHLSTPESVRVEIKMTKVD